MCGWPVFADRAMQIIYCVEDYGEEDYDAVSVRSEAHDAGHSLGAAVATLAATIWRPGWLVTLGSPRVGDAAFTATVEATHIARFVDCCDAVTEVPPEVGGYRHIKANTYLTRDARTVENPDPSFVMSDRLRARVYYSLRYSWKFWRNVAVRELADHAPSNYARAVFGDALTPTRPLMSADTA
jgi:hypothetical protein